jgi:aminoglycoside phosphotransferase
MLALVAPMAPAAYAELAQTQITDSPSIRDYRPAATDTYVTWHRNSAVHPNHYDVFAREAAGTAFKVNPDGTSAGGGGIDGTTLVYSERRPGRLGNLELFDLVGRSRTGVPSEVNTRGGDEWGPSISGDWIEFARTTQQYYREFIYNTATDELRMLDEVSRADRRNFIEPGQVSGNYVTWMHCGRVTCKVRLYDIAAQTTTVLDVASGRYQFGATVTADGTLYYGEAKVRGCGAGVRLMQLPLAGAPTTLVSFNPGDRLPEHVRVRARGRHRPVLREAPLLERDDRHLQGHEPVGRRFRGRERAGAAPPARSAVPPDRRTTLPGVVRAARSAGEVAATVAALDPALPPLGHLAPPADAWALAHGSTVTIGDHVAKFAWTAEAARRVVSQARVLPVLRHAGVPVPRVVGWRADPAVLVYRRLHGAPLDLWTYRIRADGERSAARSLARVLASFHDPATGRAVERAGIALERPTPQVTTEGIRVRLLPRLDVVRRRWVAGLADRIDEVLATPKSDVFVHGDLHGWNVVADPALTDIVGVLDLDTVGLHEAEFDFRYVPALSPLLAFLEEAVGAYEQRASRAIDIERVMAWHALTDIGDALWRTEAGVEVVAGPLARRVDAMRRRLDAIGGRLGADRAAS